MILENRYNKIESTYPWFSVYSNDVFTTELKFL